MIYASNVEHLALLADNRHKEAVWWCTWFNRDVRRDFVHGLPNHLEIHYHMRCPECWVGFVENKFRLPGDPQLREVKDMEVTRRWFFQRKETRR